ncbi:MAG: DNA-processing protein DprA [Candidatus Baltobacteraceae bacterium]
MRAKSVPDSGQALTLLTAAYLHVPARRLRALLQGKEAALAEWAAEDPSRKVAHARHRAREALYRLTHSHASLVTSADAAYPAGLLDLHDPPAFLTVRGVLPVTGIAVVGTRNASDIAQAFARGFSSQCAHAVISGLARGVDAAAHRGALEANVPTVAYVATGLGVTYPPEHLELEQAIVAAGGAIVSERLPGEPAVPWAFIQRDRLQAAHARAIVLVASELDGGAMHTMRFARELQRRRFAVTGGDFAFAGNAAAIAQGAQPLPPSPQEAVKVLHRVI